MEEVTLEGFEAKAVGHGSGKGLVQAEDAKLVKMEF